jgi:hypothetical protein
VPAPAASSVENSPLDAALFYQLLIGEIELRDNEPGAAYSVMLAAAKKSKNEQVFRRATEVALQARAGDLALRAAQDWKATLPQSLEASRYVVQLLVALNRSSETAEPLRSMIELSPPGDRVALISSLPRFFERAGDRKSTPAVLEKALAPYVDQPDTRVAAMVAIGRAAQNGGDDARAPARRCARRASRRHGPRRREGCFGRPEARAAPPISCAEPRRRRRVRQRRVRWRRRRPARCCIGGW